MISLLTRPKQDVAADGAAQPEEASPTGSPPAAQPQAPPVVAARTCAKCGAPMQELQEWCLHCGAGQPGSLSHGAGWRTGAAILAAAALLVVGASVAAYAALSRHERKPARPTLALRPGAGTAPLPGGTTPLPGGATPLPGGASTTPAPGATPAPGLPSTIKSTPPKIPLQTPTPKATGGSEPSANSLLFPPAGKSTKSSASKPSKSSGGSSKATTEQGGSQTSGGKGGEGGSKAGAGGGEPPSPILLDTNAAATYNPYSYPATLFGDPSLAIDGEGSTAWTAKVDPAKAPNMAEGLVLDLKSAQKLGSATVKTATTGTMVEIYGANGHGLPASITDPAWKRLSGAKVLKKKSTTLKLKTGGVAYRFALLWITRAPVGAASVAIDELELFPPK